MEMMLIEQTHDLTGLKPTRELDFEPVRFTPEVSLHILILSIFVIHIGQYNTL